MNKTHVTQPVTLLVTSALILSGCSGNLPSSTFSKQATPVLTTPWTSQVSQTLPLPEYPRPQMTRTDWLNLNGKWSYWGGTSAPGAQNAPTTAPNFPATPEQILVPFPAEAYLSGIQRRQEINLWYKRTFTVPAGWNGRRINLNFGAVDRNATVYINGTKVGAHSGGYDSFSFDITPYLRAGSNDLVVGVYDPTNGDGPVGKQTANPGGIFYTGNSGIWQTVWLEPTPTAHIDRMEITPDVPNNRLKVRVLGSGISGQTVEAVALNGTTQVGTATGSVGTEFFVSVPNARLWSPDDPFLYNLTVRLRSGTTVVDEVGSYFGMRSLTLGTVGGYTRPLLNGQFVFQVGPLDQGFWPDGIYTAPTDDALRFDLEQTKALGFNMTRKHIKVEPQRWYYWADKLGLLVWQDMPNIWNSGDTATRARYETELRELVDEHRNSPAIVTWVPFNEGWGAYNTNSMATLVKGWDPSRWVNAHSGINFAPGDSGNGDFLDLHDYPGPNAPTYSPGRASVLGENGGFGLKVTGHMWDPNSTFAYAWYNDVNSLTTAYESLINRTIPLISSKGLNADVYTEITDVEYELNGFYTYDRQVKKMDFARVKAVNQRLIQGIPYLQPGTSFSFKAATPGVNNMFMGQNAQLGVTTNVTAASTDATKRSTSWKVVAGLADSTCYSFENILNPGQYLRHSGFRLRTDPSDGSALFNNDATFCGRKALDPVGGISLESKNLAGYYIRHRNSELWLDPLQNTTLFKQDASWIPLAGWWKSAVSLPVNAYKSLRVTTPGFTNRYARHMNSLGYTEVVDAASAALLKQDATFKVVTGLGDSSCYSLESRNLPGNFLRHSNSRIRLDANDGSALFAQDATFCAQGGLNGQGVAFQSLNYPNRYIRHYDSALYITSGTEGNAWDNSAGLNDDVSWAIDNPWAP